MVTAKTGLLLDPYFSATKIAWLLDHVEGARRLAEAGHLAFGTVDAFLIWQLTGGRVHATDATNASRTLLYDIAKGDWDADLLKLFGIPRAILPEVRDSNASYGTTDPSILGAALPILGVAGDQQAATIGQACFAPGMVKSTYGTGCFAVLNTGAEPVASRNRLLTTIAYQLDGRRTYALEGSIFIAGAAVQWLRDGLKIIASAPESGALAAEADARAGRLPGPGLRRPRRALLAARRPRRPVRPDPRHRPQGARPRRAGGRLLPDPRPPRGHARRLGGRAAKSVLRVDGGMVASDWTMQRLADILDAPGRAAGGAGDDGPGRRLARRPQGRRLARRGGLRQALEARPRLRAGAGRSGARAQVRRLEAGRAAVLQTAGS